MTIHYYTNEAAFFEAFEAVQAVNHRAFIEGTNCANKKQLFNEFAKQFQFPSYFGQNWDAFNDCMTDLNWLEGVNGYHLFIHHFDELLTDLAADFRLFIEILEEMIIEWRKGSNYGIEKLPQRFEVTIHGDEATRIKLQQQIHSIQINKT